ncbi:MAG TPA: hypothetical protein PLP56_02720 [Candidatus Omnitrophota bacterium]|nr:hypothetical protein [Candidatus Omnitrophota bacterium]HQQ05875.1 hypothetical protein [Candidatus Omnitrophota bacterium]
MDKRWTQITAWMIASILTFVSSGCMMATKSWQEQSFYSMTEGLEIVQKDYIGTCLYDPSTQRYYARGLLRGSNRIARIKKSEDSENEYAIDEVKVIPKVALIEMPLTVTGTDNKRYEKGVVIIRDANSYKCAIDGGAVLSCAIDVKTRADRAWLWYLMLIPFDIVTFPIQALIYPLYNMEMW